MDAAEILKIRGNLGLTQSQFAAKLEVYPSHVSKWERGENKISKKNENKIYDLWSQWKLEVEGDDVIAGYDPDGMVVTDEEEAKRMDRVDDLQNEIDNAETAIWKAEARFLIPDDDDVETLKAAKQEYAKARDKLFRIRKTNAAQVTKKQLGDGITMIAQDPPFGLFDVGKTIEQDFNTVWEQLKSKLDALSNQDFDIDRIWDTFGMNPKTLSDEKKIEFFDNVLGETIEKINAVLQEFLDGPHGQAFKDKIKENLERKAKEFQQQAKVSQQNVIRKSTDRETELTREVDQLKRETRLLLQNAETQVKLNEKMDLLLDTTSQNMKEIKERLEISMKEKAQMKAHIAKLEAQLNDTQENVDIIGDGLTELESRTSDLEPESDDYR